jgi:hypothetical protein
MSGASQTHLNFPHESFHIFLDNLRLMVVSGATGSGKTHLLRQLAASGQQVLDLEFLAKHKGEVHDFCADTGYNRARHINSVSTCTGMGGYAITHRASLWYKDIVSAGVGVTICRTPHYSASNYCKEGSS